MDTFWDDIKTFIVDLDEHIIDAALLFLITVSIALFIKNRVTVILSNLSKEDENGIDNIILREIKLFPNSIIILTGLYVSYTTLRDQVDNNLVNQLISIFFYAVLGFYVIQLIAKIVRRISNSLIDRTKDTTSKNVYHYMTNILLGLLWVLAIMFVVGNLGYDVSALTTGLGISGFAIAFSIRKILFDLFSSIIIVLDKPFKIGDYIVIKDSKQGTVTNIGLRSIKLMAPDRSEVIISNGEVVSKPITNYRGLKRSSFIFDIVIPLESIKDINVPKLIRKELESNAEALIFQSNVYITEHNEESIKLHVIIIAKVSGKSADEPIDTLQELLIESMKKYEISFTSINSTFESIT